MIANKRIVSFGIAASLLLASASAIHFASVATYAVESSATSASKGVPSIYKQRSFEVIPRGNANALAAQQSRTVRSKYAPTGIYVAPNETVTITVQGGVAVDAYIHAYHVYDWRNFLEGRHTLKSGENTISSPHGGVLYLSNENEEGTATVSITGGSLIPVFEKGKHTKSDWQRMLAEHPNAPYVELVGEDVFVTASYAKAKQYTNDPGVLLKKMDEAIAIENRVAGYDSKSSNTVHRADRHYQHMVEIPNGQYYMYSGASHTGYSGDNVHDGIAFVLNENKFTKDGWGPWHELGHSNQQSLWNFENMAEVQVNIFSLSVERAFGVPSIFQGSKVYQQVSDYFAKPQAQKDYDQLREGNDIDHLFKLLMLWQLNLGFGDEFYPALHRAYREMDPISWPKTPEAKKQLFMKMSSIVANRDLTPFFDMWGLKLTSQTRNEISALGLAKLEQKIWEGTHTNPVRETGQGLLQANPITPPAVNNPINKQVKIAVDQNKIEVSIDKKTQEGANRILVMLNGTYVGESYSGKNYYTSINRSQPTVNTLVIENAPLKQGDVINVYLAPGAPSDHIELSVCQLLASKRIGEAPVEQNALSNASTPLSVSTSTKAIMDVREWAVDASYTAGEKVAYQGYIYIVLTTHTNQGDTNEAPGIAHSLFSLTGAQ